MNHLRKAILPGILVLLALSALGVSAAPAAAAVRISEAQINSSFRVANPVSRRVTNLAVDLQPGQAVITASLTLRRPAGQESSSYQIVTTWTPAISNGRLAWTLTSAIANGTPASADLVAQVNASIGASWRAYWRRQRPGRATAVTVDDTQIAITY